MMLFPVRIYISVIFMLTMILMTYKIKPSFFWVAFAFLFSPLFSAAQEEATAKKVTIQSRYRDEVKALAERAEIKLAFQTIVDLDPETVKNQVTLAQIASPPFKEQMRAARFKQMLQTIGVDSIWTCLLYTSPSPRDRTRSRMPSSA